jgi:23S rRNA pseudouridine2605 synthase
MPRRQAGATHSIARTPKAERLQKVLSELGVASRREVERWIRAGRLSINGRTAVLGARVSAEDQLRLDGRPIRRSERASRAAHGADSDSGPVIVCHRSPGEPLLPQSSAASVADRLPRRLGRRFVSISPMPLIDGGLELLTADGALAARLQRAVRALESEFSLRIRGELTEQQLQTLGTTVSGRGTRFEVRALEASGGEASNRWYRLVAVGASGHEIREWLAREGVVVVRALRTRLGGLTLPRTLARGHWRELERAEVSALLGNRDSAP